MPRPHIVGNSLHTSTVAFAALFQDLYVYKYNNNRWGEPTMRIPVSVVLDTRERIYHQIKYGGHKALEQADTRLPRIGIQIQSMTPALDRYTGKNARRQLIRTIEDGNTTDYRDDIQPVPFNISYLVTVWCSYMEHWAQLMENILPFFDPYLSIGIRERNLGIERQIKVSLESVSPNFSFALSTASDRRIVRGELSFNVETVIYKQLTSDTSEIIEKIIIEHVDITTPFSSQTIYLTNNESISGAPPDYTQATFD